MMEAHEGDEPDMSDEELDAELETLADEEEDELDAEWDEMSLKEKREAMDGPNGGDGDD